MSSSSGRRQRLNRVDGTEIECCGDGRRKAVVVVGPVPPPTHGVAVATRRVLDSSILAAAFELIHLDTSDRRSLDNLGKIDLTNVYLAVKSCIQLARICVRRRPALLYYTLSQNAPALLRDVCLSFIGRALGCGPVVQIAGARYVETARSKSVAGWLTRHALRTARRVLVLGESQVPGIAGVCRHSRVSVVPNGIAEFDSADPVPQRQRSARLHALFLGALSESKGVVDLVAALTLARSAGCEVSATLGGEWGNSDFAQRVDRLVSENGLDDSIAFPGLLQGDAKQSALEGADVYVLPSLAEGQPISILEAMSVGLPVISTHVGAVPDTVKDGVTGILIHPGDPAALAGSLCLLCDEPGLRLQMGRAGHERFRDGFTLERAHRLMVHAFILALDSSA